MCQITSSPKKPAVRLAGYTRAYDPEVMETLGTAIKDKVCVNLTYNGTDRVVLPSRVKLSKAGNLLVQARKWQDDKLVHRSYRVDKIREAERTAITAAALLAGPAAIALAETCQCPQAA